MTGAIFAGGYVSSEWSSPARRLRIDTGIRLNVANEEREGGDVRQVTEPEGDGRTQTNVRPSTSVGAIWTGWARDMDHLRAFANYRNTFKPAAADFGIGGAGEGEGPLILFSMSRDRGCADDSMRTETRCARPGRY